MREGILPDSEKLALVTPIVKKTGLDINCVSNYRPISNLTFLSKLIEHLACRQLIFYLNEHRFLASVQSAYRENYSTETATLKVASDIFNASDAGHVTLLALL